MMFPMLNLHFCLTVEFLPVNQLLLTGAWPVLTPEGVLAAWPVLAPLGVLAASPPLDSPAITTPAMPAVVTIGTATPPGFLVFFSWLKAHPSPFLHPFFELKK